MAHNKYSIHVDPPHLYQLLHPSNPISTCSRKPSWAPGYPLIALGLSHPRPSFPLTTWAQLSYVSRFLLSRHSPGSLSLLPSLCVMLGLRGRRWAEPAQRGTPCSLSTPNPSPDTLLSLDRPQRFSTLLRNGQMPPDPPLYHPSWLQELQSHWGQSHPPCVIPTSVILSFLLIDLLLQIPPASLLVYIKNLKIKLS